MVMGEGEQGGGGGGIKKIRTNLQSFNQHKAVLKHILCRNRVESHHQEAPTLFSPKQKGGYKRKKSKKKSICG